MNMIDINKLNQEKMVLVPCGRDSGNDMISTALEISSIKPVNKEIVFKIFSQLENNKNLTWIGEIIPLAYHKGRLFFTKSDQRSSLCFSPDGLLPSMFLESPMNKRCSSCPLNTQFITREDSKHCNVIHSLLVMTVETRSLLSLSIHDERAKDIELLIAALEIFGSDLNQFQADMQLSFLYRKKLCLENITFRNLKKRSKVPLNHNIPSVPKDYQPFWLSETLQKIARATEPSFTAF